MKKLILSFALTLSTSTFASFDPTDKCNDPLKAETLAMEELKARTHFTYSNMKMGTTISSSSIYTFGPICLYEVFVSYTATDANGYKREMIEVFSYDKDFMKPTPGNATKIRDVAFVDFSIDT